MKAAKDRRTNSIAKIELREEHLKDPIRALDKALKCVENPYWSWLEPSRG